MKRFAFFWPALVLLLVPLLLVGMVAHTYMTASLPFLSLYNADSAFDHIEVKGSLRNDTYGYQMDFQVRSGETSAVNRFYYHAPAGMPFSDEYKPEGFRGMSWQIWIPQDAQAKLITSDQPGISEVVISGGSSGSEEKWISYIEEWECTAVEAQLYYQNADGIEKALGLPIRLQGEGPEKLKVICEGFMAQTASKEWVKQDARPTAVYSQDELLLHNSSYDNCWQEADGYLYYINAGANRLFSFSGLYRVNLSDFLREDNFLYPQELIPPSESESCTFLKFGMFGKTPVLVTYQNGAVFIRTGYLSEKRWFEPLLVETYDAGWNPAVDICASGPAICVRLISESPDSEAPLRVRHRAISSENGSLLAWGDSTMPKYAYWSETVMFDALYRKGILYTLDFFQSTYKMSGYGRSPQPAFSAMDASGPLRGKKNQELMGLPLLSGLPPMDQEICSRIAISFVQEAES